MVPPLPAFNKLLEVCSKRNDVMETVHQVRFCSVWSSNCCLSICSLLAMTMCLACRSACTHSVRNAKYPPSPVRESHLTSRPCSLQLVEMMSGSALQPNEETHKHLEACFAYHNLQRSS